MMSPFGNFGNEALRKGLRDCAKMQRYIRPGTDVEYIPKLQG